MYKISYLEELRKRALLFLGLTAVAAVVLFLGFFIIRSFVVIPLFFVLFGLIIYQSKLSTEYRTAVKEDVVAVRLKEVFQDVYFNAKAGFDRNFIRDTELVSMGNIYNSNDLVSGKYKDVSFKQADVHIQQRTQSGKTTTTVTLFKGRWIVYTFNKSFTGFMQIRSNSNRLFGNSKPLRLFSDKPDAKRIKLENELFNERFNIYASNEHEAYYILTPHFMEKIMELDDGLDGNLVLGFIDNNLHIALYNNKDAFEPSLFKAIDESYTNEVEKDISLIKMVVDELTLDVNLYN